MIFRIILLSLIIKSSHTRQLGLQYNAYKHNYQKDVYKRICKPLYVFLPSINMLNGMKSASNIRNCYWGICLFVSKETECHICFEPQFLISFLKFTSPETFISQRDLSFYADIVNEQLTSETHYLL